MNPNQTGQIFSIDFLLAVGLVILAIGVSLNTLHTAAANEQERINQFELDTIGQTVAILLATNPNLECQLYSGTPPAGINLEVFIPGCINIQKTISKQMLGIPAGFEYNLNSPGQIFNSTDMAPVINPAATNVYRTQINIMAQNGNLPKADYDACIESGCTGKKITIQIAVWKA